MSDAAPEGQTPKPKPPRSAYTPSNLPANNRNDKKDKPEKNVQKLAAVGEAHQRPPSLAKRIGAAFTGDDTQTVGNYLLFEVAIPAFKNLLSEGVSTAVDRLLFGGSGQSAGGARRGYTPYNRYSQPSTAVTTVRSVGPSPAARSVNPRAVHNFDEIVLDNKGAAVEVIDALDELISNFDVATVADLYELVGITAQPADENWGWTEFIGPRSSTPRVRDGYAIRLPRTQPLD